MKKLNVLCVDDQREVLAALKKDLSFFDPIVTLTEAESAGEAEEVVREMAAANEPLFLIVCDHIMPGENGVDFMARLIREGLLGDTKKILLTGLADQQDTIRAINDARIDLYTEKPWDGDELNHAVRGLLAKYARQHGLSDPELDNYIE